MSPFSWQCQNLCLLSLAFIIDWRVVSVAVGSFLWANSILFNTSHVVIGYMRNFFKNLLLCLPFGVTTLHRWRSTLLPTRITALSTPWIRTAKKITWFHHQVSIVWIIPYSNLECFYHCWHCSLCSSSGTPTFLLQSQNFPCLPLSKRSRKLGGRRWRRNSRSETLEREVKWQWIFLIQW